MAEKGISIDKKRAGGPEHEYWKYRIAGLLKTKGYYVEIEKPIGEGKTVDIVATKGEENIAFEIETGKSDIEENILKIMDESFNKIIMVPLNTKAKYEILGKIKGMPLNNSDKIKAPGLKELFM